DGVSMLPVLSIVLGLTLGTVFVIRQTRLADPLIDLSLFRERAFTASLAPYGITVVLMFGGFLFLPQYLQLVRGLSPLEAGLWTLPWALTFVVGSMLTPVLARYMRPAHLIAGGMLM